MNKYNYGIQLNYCLTKIDIDLFFSSPNYNEAMLVKNEINISVLKK